jgi:hypothetical protein
MKKPVQNITLLLSRTANHGACGGAHCGAICSCDFVSSGNVVRAAGRLAHRGEALFHEAKGPASFHSIKGMDNLILIEDRDEPVQCARGVM